MQRPKPLLRSLLSVFLFSVCLSSAAFAATFSEFWQQDSAGNWIVKNGSQTVVNAWFCDDAVPENGKDIWYLIDTSGNMISSPLVHDQSGNYYSLETEHNGYYGMLRYRSGTYDGIYLDLESSHSGAFAAIRNADGIEALKNRYGVTELAIGNDNICYSSEFTGSQKASGNPAGAAGAGNSSSGQGAGSEIPENTPAGEEAAPADNDDSIGSEAEEAARIVFDCLNEYRVQNGAPEVSWDDALFRCAMIRAEECKRSFSHTRPDGSSCFTVFEECGIGGRHCFGENLASGYEPEGAVDAWSKSETHNKNMLDSSFRRVGIGFCNAGGRNFYAQLFTD